MTTIIRATRHVTTSQFRTIVPRKYGGIGGTLSPVILRNKVDTRSMSTKFPFEDKSLEVQTRKKSPYKLGKHRSNALEMIEKQTVIEVEGNMAVCDGGGGVLGHPLEYIKLGARMDYDERGEAAGVRCIYCGLRYRSKGGGHH